MHVYFFCTVKSLFGLVGMLTFKPALPFMIKILQYIYRTGTTVHWPLGMLLACRLKECCDLYLVLT